MFGYNYVLHELNNIFFIVYIGNTGLRNASDIKIPKVFSPALSWKVLVFPSVFFVWLAESKIKKVFLVGTKSSSVCNLKLFKILV